MKEVNKKFFVCEYCNKQFVNEEDCKKHELDCKKDYDLKIQQETRKKEVEDAREAVQKAMGKLIELENQYKLDYKKDYYNGYSFFDLLWR